MDFEKELDIIRQEVHKVTYCYRVHMEIRLQMNKDDSLLNRMNDNSEFWRTILYSLQTSYIAGLGRLFDKSTDVLSVNRFLNNCIKNYKIFSLDSLKNRRTNNGNSSPSWLKEFLARAFIPEQRDFQPLQAKIKQSQKLFEKKMKPIRDTVVAHNIEPNGSSRSELFSKYNSADLDDVLHALNVVCESLWELYHNGKRPDLTSYDELRISNLKNEIGNILSMVKGNA